MAGSIPALCSLKMSSVYNQKNEIMENRETIEFKTDNHVFVIKSWLTAREERAINNVVFKHVKFNPSMKQSDIREGKGMNMDFNEIPASLTAEQEMETLKQYLVSMDGVTENVTELALDIRANEFALLIAKIGEINGDQGLE